MHGSIAVSAPALPDRPARVAALCALLAVYFFSFFQRAAIPGTMFNEIQSDLKLTAVAVTSLAAVFTYVYGGVQLFVGFAADRFGGIRTLLVGGALMTIGATAFPLSHSPTMLYASRIVTALGASVMYLSIIKEACLLFPPRHFPTILGVTLMVGYSGGLAGMLPFERLVALLGWRTALLGIAAVMSLTLLAAWGILRRFNHFKPPPESFSLKPLAVVLRRRDNWPLFVLVSLNFPIYFVIQTILGKKFLQDFSGLSSASAATFTSIMILTTAIASLSASLLLPWTKHRRKPWILLGTGLLLAATGLLLGGVVCHASRGLFLLAYLLLAAAMLANPATTTTMKELNRPDSVALAISVINGLSYLAAGVVGNLSGYILDRFKAQAVVTGTSTVYPPMAYAAVFAFLALLAVIVLVVACLVRETHGQAVGHDARPTALPTG
jgi:predicted MFS family arabinose efflux permease